MIQNNKIVKVVKDQFFMLALVAMVIGFSAFKFVHPMQNSEWFYVQTDDTDIENVVVGGSAGDGTSGGDCSPTNPGPRCAVQLMLPHPSYNPAGRSIAEIEDDGGEFTGQETKYLN